MQNVKKLVIAALFAALCCVTTMVVQIPSPVNGYVNLGDCFVLLSGWILGPFYGAAAAGIGSMLADVFTGYAFYAPGTLIIKALMALAAWGTAGALGALMKKSTLVARAISAAVAEAVMVLGYFGYAALLLGKGIAAAASIPGNIAQGVAGIVSAVVLMEILTKNKLLNRLF
jgi:ECF transporter S component (folate family)